jgi:hypothetical protein
LPSKLAELILNGYWKYKSKVSRGRQARFRLVLKNRGSS